ncbi:TorD/DmsD family molecular chaperone [Rhodoplanes azumiensis]|uniref:Molecular chaperone n=1 Tax=Rhodoplanes azumiensis TaxID=1897628 RepID=A0ABW5AHW5_9BRAD
MTPHSDPLPNAMRSAVYGLLAEFWGRPLSAETIARLSRSAAVDEAGGLAAELLAPLRDGAPDITLRLGVEHTRLFGGLQEGYGPPPPYESVWRDGPVDGAVTAAVAAAYQAAGYTERVFAGPCDQLAEELRFVAALCAAEDAAVSEGSDDALAAARHHHRRFLEEHLLVWAPGYCRALAAQSREPLYAALARVTAQILHEDSSGFALSAEPAGDAPAVGCVPAAGTVPGDGPCRMQ